MLRSMFSGVSGLRSHQTMMDVVANNVANVNTAGFKSSRVTFQENLSQVMRGASGQQPVRAGTNPVQIGLGTQVGAVDGVFTQGAAQLTGRSTDVAIQGEGFFVVNVGNETRYTRAGALSLDRAGHLATPSGGILQGWLADPTTGTVDFNSPMSNLKLPAGQVLPPVATATVDVGGSLPAGAADGTVVRTTIDVYDELGNPHTLAVQFTKTATPNEWTVDAAKADGTSLGTATLSFDDVTGAATGVTELDLGNVTFDADAGAQPMKIDFSDPQIGLNQLGSVANVEARDQDGSAMGTLRGFTIGNDGAITGQFSNGNTDVLGYLGLAAFTNPSGLTREGESLFAASGNSGLAQVARPGSESVGLLSAGTLEMSNVDLAQEFTNLIVAQRGFQANSRSITTSDEMLQELVNLKR